MEATIVADKIIKLFIAKGGCNYAGEEITQLEHACQAAAFAEQEGYEDEVILAAFLHDIGHLIDEDDMDGFGVQYHEEKGAVFLLENGFSRKIATLVRSHVDAKRYLCFANPTYYRQLSDASKITLQYQGGTMSSDEAMEFEKSPLKNLIIKMRTWDEKAKEDNKPLQDLEVFRKMIINHLLKNKEV